MNSMLNINLAKAKSKVKTEITSTVKNETKKNDRKHRDKFLDKHKVQKHFHQNEYIIFHEGKRDAVKALKEQSVKPIRTKDIKDFEINENFSEKFDNIRPDINVMRMEDTPLPSDILSFPRISIDDKCRPTIDLSEHMSNFDFLLEENRNPNGNLTLLQMDKRLIPLDQIPPGGGKIGEIVIYQDNSAAFVINGEPYPIHFLTKPNMEVFHMAPHPSDPLFEMTSLGFIDAHGRIEAPFDVDETELED